MDADTDQAVMVLRSSRLGNAAGQNAGVIGEQLRTQFPDVPDLGRILVAVSELQSTLAVSGCGHVQCVIATIGLAGVKLNDGQVAAS